MLASIVGAGIWLPVIGMQLAVVGMARFLRRHIIHCRRDHAAELAVTISALRIGAFNKAIANLLGSNLFNVTIFAIDDLFYLKGQIFAHVPTIQAFSALSARSWLALRNRVDLPPCRASASRGGMDRYRSAQPVFA